MMIICELDDILKELGIKKNWLCTKAGVAPQTLSNTLKGRNSISLLNALKLSKVLNKSVEEIWRLVEENNPRGDDCHL
jgi:DNA-binding XRE family transcriptional regulator